MELKAYYRASEIYSHPEVEACPAREADPTRGITVRYARRARPARRGLLPIGKTQFERLHAAGKFPEPDAELNGTPYWSGALAV